MTTLQRQNLDSARRLAAQKVGIDLSQAAGLPYGAREAYNNELARLILAYPTRFDAATVARARDESVQVDEALEDASFNWSEFAGETVKPLGDGLQSIGNGVFTVANATRWAIPLLAVVAVVVIAENLSKGTAISTAKKLFK